MKLTRAYLAQFAKEEGYEPVQVDGIPEGFAFKTPALTIGGVEHPGVYLGYQPLSDFEVASGNTIEELIKNYG